MWINKYAPRDLADIHGQEKVISLIASAIQGESLDQLLLFGNYGVGKTAIARCIGAAVNCENFSFTKLRCCWNCSSCLFQNTVQSPFKEYNCEESKPTPEWLKKLKCGMSFYPLVGKKQVFLLDEIHMLSARQQVMMHGLLGRWPDLCVLLGTTNRVDKLERAFFERFIPVKLREPGHKAMIRILNDVLSRANEKVLASRIERIAVEHLGNPREAITALERHVWWQRAHLRKL